MLRTRALTGYWLDKRTNLSPRTFTDYEHVFARLVESIGVEYYIEGITADDMRRSIADRGYDAELLREFLRTWSIEAVIPYRETKSSTKGRTKLPVDWYSYKERHLIECIFNRIKHYRRIFTRFDKLASRYLST